MIYQIEQIKDTLVNSSQLATAAGVSSMAGRIFVKIGEIDMVGNVNLGRLPCIYLRGINVDYTHDAEPDHVGTRATDYTMRILVPTFINRSEIQYSLLEKIKTVALSEITKNLELGITDVRVETPQVLQMATIMDIVFSTETSYDNQYDEEGN